MKTTLNIRLNGEVHLYLKKKKKDLYLWTCTYKSEKRLLEIVFQARLNFLIIFCSDNFISVAQN